MITTNNYLSDCYDYIVSTVICQNRLLPKDILYGDGSIFNNDRKMFDTLYDTIKELIDKNELCSTGSRVQEKP